MYKCIWCKKEHSTTDKEHIIPEPLGCPKDFMLSKGEVCKVCNNNLAHLDRAVIDDFDFITFMQGIPRKRKRPPQILSRGNAIGYQKTDEWIIFFNLNKKKTINVDGFSLSPFGKSDRNVNAKFKGDAVSFNTKIGEDAKFTRGILKIAFSALVYFLGSELLLNNAYDSIRDFVIQGKGERKILVLPAGDQNYKNEVKPLIFNKINPCAIFLRLGHIVFLVDLTPKMQHFPMLKKQAETLWGKNGWTFLPIDSESEVDSKTGTVAGE